MELTSDLIVDQNTTFLQAHNKVCIDLINHLTLENSIGAEIGVRYGWNAESMLDYCQIKHLYLVDVWLTGASWVSDKPTKRAEKMFTRVSELCQYKHPGRATIVRGFSQELSTATKVPDELDFVFIDGDHHYQPVMDDLALWVPKVKSGGLIFGHDWHRHFPDVGIAVSDFAKRHRCFIPPNGKTEFDYQYIPAPSGDPVVYKSWTHNRKNDPEKISGGAHVWWAIKK